MPEYAGSPWSQRRAISNFKFEIEGKKGGRERKCEGLQCKWLISRIKREGICFFCNEK
jgi:hypothetical protein